MKAFNLQRFAKLARWTLTNDKAFYRRNLLNATTTLTLVFVAFTTHLIGDRNAGVDQTFSPCSLATILMFMIIVVTGGGYMFMSMTGKHERQTLLMLPASNLEKFLMRYASWLFQLLVCIVAYLVADGLQYVVNWLLGSEHLMLVTTYIADNVKLMIQGGMITPLRLLQMAVTALWVHSLYVLGANFFRSHKYNWAFTTITLILMVTLVVWLFYDNNAQSYTSSKIDTLETVIWILPSLFHFWLAFRLFCRQQVIGKFINI